MTSSERAKALSDLLSEHEQDNGILRPMDSRLRWLGKAVPLLSFNPTLHQNALTAADVLARPGFSSSMYEQMEARILLLARQGITELEHGLTAAPTGVVNIQKESEPRTLTALWRQADLPQRLGLLSSFALVFVVGFLCGKVGFFGRLYDLIREISP